MTQARLPLWTLLSVCVLLAGGRTLLGQTVIFSTAPPAAPAPAGATGPGAALAPPPPLGIPPEQLPRFEVESVKKFEGRTGTINLRTPGGGRITVLNMPLRTIIMQAFGGLRDYQMSGGPSWMTTDRFTINAKAATNVPRDQLMLMLRAALVDRFQLKYHVEKKEMQAYVLTTAEPEWKPTARMKPVDCTAGRGAKPPAPGTAAAPPPPPPTPFRPDAMCSGSTMMSTNGIQARGVTMTSFVSLLSSIGQLGVVHDKTGLTGTYQIDLDASPTALLRSLSSSLAILNPNNPENLLPNVAEGRSLGAAVRDLGLKLDRQKEMIDVLVIDSVSQPDED